MMTDLLTCLTAIPDRRRAEGKMYGQAGVILGFPPRSGSPALCVDHAARRTRWRSRSKLARPYI